MLYASCTFHTISLCREISLSLETILIVNEHRLNPGVKLHQMILKGSVSNDLEVEVEEEVFYQNNHRHDNVVVEPNEESSLLFTAICALIRL